MRSNRVFILGVPLDIFSTKDLKQRLLDILAYRHGKQLVTPNPEFLLLAQNRPDFLTVLREASISMPDGIGLKFAGWLKGIHIPRHTGADITRWLLAIAEKRGYRVAILNWQDGLSKAEEIRASIQKSYPKLLLYIEDVDPKAHYDFQALQRFRPTLLFTAFGAPEQDLFIARFKRRLPTMRLGMGVGGSFDYLTKKLRRAPRFFRLLGFEWLWRLSRQPLSKQRWQRIMTAVTIFPLTVLRWELRRFRFRPNVVALIVNNHNEVLILNARGRGDYWGLPQGGQERGESVETAIRREVFEETGLRDIEIMADFKDVYRYVWNKPYTHSGYKGQRQTLCIVRYRGVNNAVQTNPLEHKAYRWVLIDELIKRTSPVHKKQYELFLQKYKEMIEQQNTKF